MKDLKGKGKLVEPSDDDEDDEEDFDEEVKLFQLLTELSCASSHACELWSGLCIGTCHR